MTKQNDHNEKPQTDRLAKGERPAEKKRDLASWFSFGDWRVQTTEEWALA